MRLALFTILTLLMPTGIAALAQVPDASPTNLVKAELLADVSAIQPGKPFTVGVRLTVAPEWHVYWKNPGDSGLPTKVKWQLPPGYVAGELQYPIPVKFVDAGNIVGYGYKDEVMLMATVTPSVNAAVGKPAKISADVSWLSCKDVCIPGKTTVSTDLEVSWEARPSPSDAITRWRELLPDNEQRGKWVESVDHSAADPLRPEVTIRWRGAAQKDVQIFFPADDVIVLTDERIESNDGVTTIRYKQSKLGESINTEPLTALLAFTDEIGRRRGIDVILPRSLTINGDGLGAKSSRR